MNKKISTLYKSIIISLIIIVVVLISVFIYYLYKIEKNRETSFDESTKIIVKETDMVDITDMYAYQEKELYHIFIGENKTGEEMITSVRLEKDKDISSKNINTHKSTELMSKESILNEWAQTCNQCEMVKIQPAVIDKELLWEITYNDADDRYVFVYYLMIDGKEYEEFKLKRNFN